MNKLIILSILSFSFTASATDLMSLKDFLKQELVGAAKISKESFSLTKEQRAALTKAAPSAQDESFTFYYAKDAAEKIKKACTVVAQKGKEGPLSIGTCFDAKGLVASVYVLSSEEERGKPTSERKFLKQFEGKKDSDVFTVGKDVDGVSGATYSSKSVAEAVRKSSFAYKTFVGGKL